MTVAELIAELQKHPPETKVKIWEFPDCFQIYLTEVSYDPGEIEGDEVFEPSFDLFVVSLILNEAIELPHDSLVMAVRTYGPHSGSRYRIYCDAHDVQLTSDGQCLVCNGIPGEVYLGDPAERI